MAVGDVEKSTLLGIPKALQSVVHQVAGRFQVALAAADGVHIQKRPGHIHLVIEQPGGAGFPRDDSVVHPFAGAIRRLQQVVSGAKGVLLDALVLKGIIRMTVGGE